VIEQVARDQEQIDPICERPIDDAPEDVPVALEMGRLLGGIAVAIAIEMHVGGVKHSQGSS
jgi:hypothetical protein